jgi:hypothetical protein
MMGALGLAKIQFSPSYIMSGRATAIFVGEGSPTIPAHNLPSQKPAPTGI